jgi:hypothetical protein
MFGCHAVYVADEIMFVSRHKGEPRCDDGAWIATTTEHHDALRRRPGQKPIKRPLDRDPSGW